MTVADAIGDPVCRSWVEEWWDEASRCLRMPADEVADYRAALLDTFADPAIRHALGQVAADGSQKIPVRVPPTLRAELAAGRVPAGASRVLAAWIVCAAPWSRTSSPRTCSRWSGGGGR